MLQAYKIAKDTLKVEHIDISSIKDALGDSSCFVWVDFENPPDVWPNSEEMSILKCVFKIHFLVLEDCVAKKHYPKVDEHENYTFFIISKLYEREDQELDYNKICIITGKDFVITYRHTEIKEITAVKKALEAQQEDFKDPIDVLHSIADRIVDDYISIIDSYTTKVDEIEDLLFEKHESREILQNVNILRKNLIILRRSTLIQKEMFYNLSSGTIKISNPGKIIYFKDVYDHLDRVLWKIDNQKEYIAGLLNIYVGLSTQKLNSLVKFLTIISATLFPASLMAGIFGMNFAKMPLIGLDSGFYLILFLMLLLSLITILFFQRQKWLF
ncbi:MAG: hypothetical protein A2Y25_06760 [Candidatus Melainabacteria bacterium GWF2_37_15]|nr:MAG: hypothetical protein A2Y25_06760 [Candidatus Melainabacteria bacterium GWF2_37_15]